MNDPWIEVKTAYRREQARADWEQQKREANRRMPFEPPSRRTVLFREVAIGFMIVAIFVLVLRLLS